MQMHSSKNAGTLSSAILLLRLLPTAQHKELLILIDGVVKDRGHFCSQKMAPKLRLQQKYICQNI